jgi:glycosyltransferase involved in cell wall biosynthesis
MQVAWRGSDDDTVHAIEDARGITRVRRFVRRVRARWRLKLFPQPPEAELFNPARTSFGAELVQMLPSFDIAHLHWVAHLVDVEAVLPVLAERGPIVWTLHDMDPLTGGCHYAGGCERFADCCGRCPQLARPRENDLSRKVWRQKDRAFRRIGDDRLHVVAPSQWMADLARKSSLMGRFEVTVIPNGVDTAVFRPQDRATARRRLDLPPEAKIVLFVAHNLTNRRKGGATLMKALERPSDVPGLTLLTVGEGRLDPPPGVAHRHIAPVADEDAMADLYNAADVLAIASSEDNLPNTMLEAMACGLPVAAFDAGGVGETIDHGRTGMLAPAGDVDAFARIIGDLLGDDAKRQEMAAACRQLAERRFSLSAAAGAYVQMYRSLLEKRPTSPHQGDQAEPSASS